MIRSQGLNASSLLILQKIHEGWVGKQFGLGLNFCGHETQFYSRKLRFQVGQDFCGDSIPFLFMNLCEFLSGIVLLIEFEVIFD